MVNDWCLGVVVFEKTQSSCGKYVADGGADARCKGRWWGAGTCGADAGIQEVRGDGWRSGQPGALASRGGLGGRRR